MLHHVQIYQFKNLETGEDYLTASLHEMAKELKLNYQSLRDLVCLRTKSHRGWSFEAKRVDDIVFEVKPF